MAHSIWAGASRVGVVGGGRPGTPLLAAGRGYLDPTFEKKKKRDPASPRFILGPTRIWFSPLDNLRWAPHHQDLARISTRSGSSEVPERAGRWWGGKKEIEGAFIPLPGARRKEFWESVPAEGAPTRFFEGRRPRDAPRPAVLLDREVLAYRGVCVLFSRVLVPERSCLFSSLALLTKVPTSQNLAVSSQAQCPPLSFTNNL